MAGGSGRAGGRSDRTLPAAFANRRNGGLRGPNIARASYAAIGIATLSHRLEKVNAGTLAPLRANP